MHNNNEEDYLNNEEEIDGEYHDVDEQIEIARSIVDALFPKEFVAILNPEKYLEARSAILAIVAILNAKADDYSRPTYRVEDVVLGTAMRFTIQFNDMGAFLLGRGLKAIADALPYDSEIVLTPQKRCRAMVEIYFKNIKVIVDN